MAVPGPTPKLARAVAARIQYLADRGDPAVAQLASRAVALFHEINSLSTLTPDEALVVAGCVSPATEPDVPGRVINVVAVMRDRGEPNEGRYIERTLLGDLSNLRDVLERLDAAFRGLGIREDHRPRWVREGLDYPDPGDGLGDHIARANRQAEGLAGPLAHADAYVQHVKGLPARLLSGEVPPDSVLDSVAIGLSLGG